MLWAKTFHRKSSFILLASCWYQQNVHHRVLESRVTLISDLKAKRRSFIKNVSLKWINSAQSVGTDEQSIFNDLYASYWPLEPQQCPLTSILFGSKHRQATALQLLYLWFRFKPNISNHIEASWTEVGRQVDWQMAYLWILKFSK